MSNIINICSMICFHTSWILKWISLTGHLINGKYQLKYWPCWCQDAKQTETGSQFCYNWLKLRLIISIEKWIKNTCLIKNPITHWSLWSFSLNRWLETCSSAVVGLFWYDTSNVQKSLSSLANGWLIRHGRWCCLSRSAVLVSTFLSPGSDFIVEMSPCLPLGWVHVGLTTVTVN